MNQQNKIVSVIVALILLIAIGLMIFTPEQKYTGEHAAEEEVVKGPHNGRLLTSGDFVLELAIFETGVPPEFRVWATYDGEPVKPGDIDLNVKLTRLGGKVDDINFKPFGDALRGDMEIYEPHSFVVTINAVHQGTKHTWEYDNFEGRTKIETAVAKALEIETGVAGPVILKETINVFGQLAPNAERTREITARYEGLIKSVNVSVGDKVEKGQALVTIESNESLNRYSIEAPISGVITRRNANAGEQTDNRKLFTIVDPATLWAELSVFSADRSRVKVGAPVSIKLADGEQTVLGKIANISVVSEANQSVKARVVLDNQDGQLVAGSFVQARIQVDEHPVELAVKRSGLQAFRDFTVVYAQIGEEYEVRMLELGRQDNDWVEVLGGLEPGTRYVTGNSYVIKADIEKSGASHDH